MGSDVARTRELARQFAVPHAGTGPGDLAGRVDAVIVGDRHGALHREHAVPHLVAGLPVFVDKPPACSVADAEAMLEAAAKSGAPLLSGSALRWQADTAVLESRMRGLQGPLEVSAFGTWYPDRRRLGGGRHGLLR
ncbi:MAG: Gfo/Idh/MocA family oxidoreductase [Devosia sp.]